MNEEINKQYLNLLEAANNHLTLAISQIQSHSQKLEANSSESNTDNILEELASSQNSISTNLTEAESALGLLQETVSETEVKLEDIEQSLAESIDYFENEINLYQQDFDAAQSEVETDFDGARETINNIDTNLVEARDTTQQSFADLVQAMADIQQTVQSFQTDTEEEFENFNSSLIEAQTTTESMLADFMHQLSEGRMNEISTATNSFENHLINSSGLLPKFSTIISDDIASNLQQKAEEILTNAADNLVNELEKRLKTMLEQEIADGVVEVLLKEITMNQIIAQVSIESASSLSVSWPFLKAAYKVLTSLNLILENLEKVGI